MLFNRSFYEQLYRYILERIVQEIYAMIGALPGDGIGNHTVACLGYTTPDHVEYGLQLGMDIWVNAVDNLLIKTDPDSEAYLKLWLIRGLTFPEYQLVFTGSIEENEYKHYRGLIFLRLRDKVDRQNFTARYANDFLTYQQLMEKHQVPILNGLAKKKCRCIFP